MGSVQPARYNFTGPDTVDLDGVKAFDITGGCTWQQEG
jgi:hypothetical protein